MRTLLTVVFALLAGCHSNDEPAPPSQDSAHAAANTPVGAAPFGDGDRKAPDIDPAEVDKANQLDADDAIASYGRDCKPSDSSSHCRAMRARVEYTFLESILWLQSAGHLPDRQLYRVAAVAENPQLAAVGLRGLILTTAPLPQPDQQLIMAALDSPYRGVRQTVLQFANNLPAVRELWPRIANDSNAYTDFPYLDDQRDAEPDHSVIGDYPNARFRYFASDAARPWFTTTDSPDKVIAFLTKGGSQALTGTELNAKNQADAMQTYMQAATQASGTGDTSKVMDALQQFQTRSSTDWTRQLSDVEGAGEIRFVQLTPAKVVAVFDDALLHATSIVAVPPPAMPEDQLSYVPSSADSLDNQLQQAKQQAEQQELFRQILGH